MKKPSFPTYPFTGRAFCIVRVAGSNFTFWNYHSALDKMLEFSKADRLKYVFYSCDPKDDKGTQRPLAIMFGGRIYRRKSWAHKVTFSNFINSLI